MNARAEHAKRELFFPIEESVLCRQAIANRVLCRYDLASPVKCHLHHCGFNNTYAIFTGRGTYYLRVYKTDWRRRSEIESEVEMLAYLCRHRHPVSGPIKRTDGKYLTRIAAPEGARYAVLFTEAPGKVPPANLARSRKCGSIMARMHVDLDRCRRDARRQELDLDWLIASPLRRVRSLLSHRQADYDYLTETANGLKAQIGRLLPKTPPAYGWIHGDIGFIHNGNVHEDEAGNLTLFDFDFCGYGWRAFDMAVFLWNRVLEFRWTKTGRARTTRRWNAFVDGYSKVRVLQENELTCCRLFVPVRHIQAMGVHAHTSKGHLSDEYFDRMLSFTRQATKFYAPEVISD